MFLSGKRSPILGIDVSSSAVKLLELSRASGKGGPSYRVESYAVEPLPANSVVEKTIKDPDAVGATIRNVVRKSGTKAKQAAMAVSGSADHQIHAVNFEWISVQT